MFAPGSVRSKTPKLSCELKGRVQKSSPAALVAQNEDYFWNLSLGIGSRIGPNVDGFLPSIREYLDSFKCTYPAAVVTPVTTKPDTPITVIPETVYPAGTPVCDKKDFKSFVGRYESSDPSQMSPYQTLIVDGNAAVAAAMNTYNSKCSVSLYTYSFFNTLNCT